MVEEASMIHPQTNDAMSDFTHDSHITVSKMREIILSIQQDYNRTIAKALSQLPSSSKSSSISSPPKTDPSKPEVFPDHWVYTIKEITETESFPTSFECPAALPDVIKKGLFSDTVDLIVKLQRLFVWCNHDKEELCSGLNSILFGTPYESKKHIVKSSNDLGTPAYTEIPYEPDAAGVFTKTNDLKYVVVPVTHVGREEENVEAILILMKVLDLSSGSSSFICHVIYPNTLNNPFPPRQGDASPLSDEFEFIATDIAKKSFKDAPDNLKITNIKYKLPFFLACQLTDEEYVCSKYFAKNILNVGFLLLTFILPSPSDLKKKYNQHQLLTVEYAVSCKNLLLDEPECDLNENERTAVVIFSLMQKSKHCLEKKSYRKKENPKFEYEMTMPEASEDCSFSLQHGDPNRNFSAYLDQLEDMIGEFIAFPFSTHLLSTLFLTPNVFELPTAQTGDQNFSLSEFKRGTKNASVQSEHDSQSVAMKQKSKKKNAKADEIDFL